MVSSRGSRRASTGDYGYPSADLAPLVAKAELVTERLIARYGHARFSDYDPLSMLVDIVLSHRTKNAQTFAAYKALLARFGDWVTVRDAPTADAEAVVARCRSPPVSPAAEILTTAAR